MATTTPNYSFQKPTVSGDSGVWGGYLNANWASIDSLLGGNTAITGIDINSGSIDGTAIGAAAASTAAFTTLSASGTITFGGVALTATGTEINYLDGVTSNIQTQLDASGAGSVTSVAFSTGSTGLTASGSPITGSGTIGLAGTLAVAHGGTGITSFGSGVATFLGTPSSANLATAVTDETGSGALVFATSPTFVTPALGTPASGTLSSCTVDGTDEVGFRNVPQNSQSAAYTLVLADAGKHIFHPVADNTARTFTIPANASVAYPVGTAITFINMAVANVTIAITSDTLTLSDAGTAGSRTLATNGSATCIKITSTQWIISGSGLT
tara:strand:- start:459 stop:1439 length:981 start_codon:yes stop_codon:yes gene_type:complete